MTLTTVEACAYLHHLNLTSPDPERLANFYREKMDMPELSKRDGLWYTQGPGRRIFYSEGSARGLGHAGFAVRDAEALLRMRERTESEELSPQDFETSMFEKGAFSVSDPDGNIIVFGLSIHHPPDHLGSLNGPLQHLTLASTDLHAIEDFYAGKLGFAISDQVVDETGKIRTSFMRSNHEHHSLACFLQDRQGIDHHSYETGEWIGIRNWSDHFASHHIQLMWGPGRHGPGNNLFIFIEDPDGGWIEVSAELEVVHDRPKKIWAHEERTLNLWGKGILRS